MKNSASAISVLSFTVYPQYSFLINIFAAAEEIVMTKKTLKIIAFPVLLFISASVFAQTVTAWGDTLSDAEAKIARQAEKAGAGYQITSARVGWITYVTAILTPLPENTRNIPPEEKKIQNKPLLHNGNIKNPTK